MQRSASCVAARRVVATRNRSRQGTMRAGNMEGDAEVEESCPKRADCGLIGQKLLVPRPESPSMSPPDRAEEFVFLLARHERQLGAYVMTMVPHPQDADDILQEAKVVMWRHFAKFESGTNFGAWSRKIAFHQVLAYRKRKHRD